jgi:hypothetical protein
MNRLQYAQTIIFISGGKVHNDHSNELALVAWMEAEGSVARWNPFDTTEIVPGSTDLPGNPAHVQQYPSLEAGLNAFFETLASPDYGYPEILKALKTGNCACAVVEAVANSQWGTWRGQPQMAVAEMLATEAAFSQRSSVTVA